MTRPVVRPDARRRTVPSRPPAHFHPRPVRPIARLPATPVIVSYGIGHWYLADRYWYRWRPEGFTVVTPPIGLVAPMLPTAAIRITIGGVAYWTADNVYYREVRDGYRVVEAPAGIERHVPLSAIEIVPLQRQSDRQLERDRYACHVEAVDASRFDPTLDGGGVPDAVRDEAREYYFAVFVNCLEERGYEVRY